MIVLDVFRCESWWS